MTVPRRLPRTQGQRIRNVAVTHASLSGQGMTASARPVPQGGGASAQVYTPPSGLVTGRNAGPGSVSITTAGGGSGSSNASGTGSIAIGDGSGPVANQAIAIGVYSYAYGVAGAAVGYNAKALGVDSTSIGPYTTAQKDNSTAVGYGSQAYGVNSIAFGGATAANDYDVVLGGDAHHVIVTGSLVVKDGAGNLRRIVVDGTTGALSTVAYP